MNNLASSSPILRRFARASVLVSVSFLVSSPPSAFCSTEIDVSSVTNRYFQDYEQCTNFVHDQLVEVESTQDEIDDLYTQIGAYRESVSQVKSSIGIARAYLQSYHDYGSENDYQETMDWLDQCYDDLETVWLEYTNSYTEVQSLETKLGVVRSSLSSYNLPTYQIVVENVTNIVQGSGGVGCNCPDYTSILNSIHSDLLSIRTYLLQVRDFVSDLDINVTDFVNLIWSFFERLSVLTGQGYDDDPWNQGTRAAEVPGMLLSNAWASASPQTLQSRIMRYTSYADEELEPTPTAVAGDVPIVAIVGLLYRMQHFMSMTNAINVYSSAQDDKEREAKEDAEEAEASMTDNMQDEDVSMDIETPPDEGLIALWTALSSLIDDIGSRISVDGQHNDFIVLDSDGVTVDLRGTSRAGPSSAAVSRNGRIAIPHVHAGQINTFEAVVNALFTLLWYCLAGLALYYIACKAVRLIITGTSLAFSIAGGDLTGAVQLAERFGVHLSQ